MKRHIRLTEDKLKRVVRESVYRILREYMFDNPLNSVDLDGSVVDGGDDFTAPVDSHEYDPCLYGQEIYDDDRLSGSKYVKSASDFNSPDEYDDMVLNAEDIYNDSKWDKPYMRNINK